LDWLANQLIDSGWSIKSMHRLIMMSAAYQRASRLPGENNSPPEIAGDPDNKLLTRFVPRRLEAECIRDAMLAAGGNLDLREGGPAGPDMDGDRRSLYVQTPRWSRAYFSTLFDAADPDQPIGKRNVTAVAPQALFFMDHPLVRTQAEAIAKRISASKSDSSRLAQLYRLLFARSPSAGESAIAADFLRSESPKGQAPGAAGAWTDLVQILLSSNEFSYVD
jgi:hypothetical protein